MRWDSNFHVCMEVWSLCPIHPSISLSYNSETYFPVHSFLKSPNKRYPTVGCPIVTSCMVTELTFFIYPKLFFLFYFVETVIQICKLNLQPSSTVLSPSPCIIHLVDSSSTFTCTTARYCTVTGERQRWLRLDPKYNKQLSSAKEANRQTQFRWHKSFFFYSLNGSWIYFPLSIPFASA